MKSRGRGGSRLWAGHWRLNVDSTGLNRCDHTGPFRRETTGVGSFPANAWGICDMHGNVCEWCRDGYVSNLPGGVDPETCDVDVLYVFRGWSWDLRGVQCLSSARSAAPPYARGSGLGFRVALVADRP
jgi:formylglycine-generating enzyme required for sulfatase activity